MNVQSKKQHVACCAEVIAACHVSHFVPWTTITAFVQDYCFLPQVSDQLRQTPSGREQSVTTNNFKFADLSSLHHSTASPRHCLELLVGPVETEAALGRSPDHPSHAKASTLNEEGSRDSRPPTNMTAGRQDVYCRQLI